MVKVQLKSVHSDTEEFAKLVIVAKVANEVCEIFDPLTEPYLSEVEPIIKGRSKD